MLFPGLQGQHKYSLPFLIYCLTCDPAGHPPDKPLLRCKKPQGRSAETDLIAQGLSLTYGNVRSIFTRWLNQAQSNGINGHNKECPGAMHHFFDLCHGFQMAEKIRMLNKNTGGLVHEMSLELFRIELALRTGDGLDGNTRAMRIGMYRMGIMRMHTAGDNDPVTSFHGTRHHHGLRCCRGPVIHGRIGNL